MTQAQPSVPRVSMADAVRFIYTRMKQGQHAAVTEIVKKYGNFFEANIRGKSFFIITEPRWLRQILVTNQKNYTKSVMMKRFEAVLGSGLFTSDGALWKRQRQLIQPAYSQKQISIYSTAVEKHVRFLFQRLAERATSDGKIDIYPEMVHFTLDVVMETILGSQNRGVHQRVHAVLSILIDQVESASTAQRFIDALPVLKHLPLWRSLLAKFQKTSGQSYEAAVAEFNQILAQIVSERQTQVAANKEAIAKDVLSILIKARDEQREGMSDTQLRDEIAISLLAGHETSAVTLAWAIVLLAQNPRVGSLLLAELSQQLQGRPCTMADMDRLPYAKAVIQETMRLYPAIWRLARAVEADDTMGDVRIPKGAIVIIVPFITHRLPEHWSEPELFRPERFLGDEETKRELLSYLPFGAGPRVCIGQNLAMMEMMLALADVWQKFAIELEPGADLTLDAKLALRPRGTIPIRIQLRP